MTGMNSAAKICMVTHQGLARHLQSLFSKEEGVLSVDLNKGRTLGTIGTTEFSDLEEQGKLVILCAVEHAERLYAFAYEKLELSTKSNGLLYSQTVAASASPRVEETSSEDGPGEMAVEAADEQALG